MFFPFTKVSFLKKERKNNPNSTNNSNRSWKIRTSSRFWAGLKPQGQKNILPSSSPNPKSNKLIERPKYHKVLNICRGHTPSLWLLKKKVLKLGKLSSPFKISKFLQRKTPQKHIFARKNKIRLNLSQQRGLSKVPKMIINMFGEQTSVSTNMMSKLY
jgi:hypothetical protein